MRFSRLAVNVARLSHAFKRRNWFGSLKGSPVCAYCYRVGYVRIRTATGVEWRCDWHVTERIPREVLRSEFNYREGGVAR